MESLTNVSLESQKLEISERLLNNSKVRYLGSWDYNAFINKDIKKTEIYKIYHNFERNYLVMKHHLIINKIPYVIMAQDN